MPAGHALAVLIAGAVFAGASSAPCAAEQGEERAQRPAAPDARASAPDSASLRRTARDAQAAFERTRVRHAPWSWWASSGSCDEPVGRFCLRFGPEDDGPPSWTPPEEPEEVVAAREDLLATLADVARAHPGDGWVAGQRVAYLIEAGRAESALAAARECRSAEPGWCRALEGLAHHAAGRTPAAEAAFEAAVAALPEDEMREWTRLDWLVDHDTWRALRSAGPEGRPALEAAIWRASDPLFLVEGNQLRAEHFARHTLARIRSDARNPHGIGWGRDLTEMLVRYGPIVAYERVREPINYMGPSPVVGRFDPWARGVVASIDGVRDPGEAQPESFRTDLRRARSRHGAGPAPRIRALDVQLARFRRGEDLLLVGAWELGAWPRAPDAEDAPDPEDAPHDAPHDAPAAGTHLQSALFLLGEEASSPLRGGAETWEVPGTAGRGAATIRAPAGRYLVSVEALDADARRAWRHRSGIALEPLAPDVLALSDLLLLESAGGAGPDVFEERIRSAFPGSDVPAAPIEVAWEVYGLPEGDSWMRFRLTLERDDRGLLRRAGEALRIVSPRDPVRVSWEEAAPDDHEAGEPLLRIVDVDLSGLDPGSYVLRLTLDVSGRTGAASERALRVGVP